MSLEKVEAEQTVSVRFGSFPRMKSLTYKDAGVDIDEGDRFVEQIKPFAKQTKTPYVLDGLGGFAGLCTLPDGLEEPVLVSGTDGVGTKLKLAFETGVHHTVGQDLVAMCVNDILTVGAKPLFFLDYFATGKLNASQATDVVRGIADGCKQAGCALLGGETAELPGFYKNNEYDLAGFTVGVVSKKKILDGKSIAAGDQVIALASSGLHSNGFSLARKALLEVAGRSLSEKLEDGVTLGEVLLRPTRIYVSAVESVLQHLKIHGMCHITGGGLVGNLPRILPKGLRIEIRKQSWQPQAIFQMIQQAGHVSDEEMFRAFNMGIGFVIVCAKEESQAVIQILTEAGEKAWIAGQVVKSNPEAEQPIVDLISH